MLIIELNRANYEYDVNSLVRAFYPGENVTILTPESTVQRRRQTEESAQRCIQADERILRMSVELSEGGARVELGGQLFTWDHGRVADYPYKQEFKRFLYGSLRQFTRKALPWGSLTGIRPTKLAFGMLEQGCTEQEILDTFTGTYDVSGEKARLGLDIARREREILRTVEHEGDSEGYSLYVGIPFCPTTCLYCSFTSFPIAGYKKLVDAYIDCLIREMEAVSSLMSGRALDSVYIGGGTPTTLEPEQLVRLIKALKRYFDFGTVKEFTVEAGRADSITREKLEALYGERVSRISVNPQTMNQRTLDIIGRRATVEQVEAAYRLAREVGFDNINMDLILGLPGETEDDVRRTIDQVTALAPDSLTVHSLAIKRASHMSQWIQENGVETLRNTDETMRIAAEGARRLGMEPYYLYRQKNMSGNFENVGYAKPGKYGLYNILIMEEVQSIVALGAGSITKRVYTDGRIERCENVKEVAQYIGRIEEMIERKKRLLAD
ncbi:MAG: coproporphyrinogen dehydrogenase HemZ [Butyrivibrio sp.]|nr:coproporphyrinogen dehydrogenase HemZ [Muribaculum sp.]MCM1551581.1 coproporphyrinogen dehydrogenase HemZ [Butyrivibrio sp.]